MHSIIRSAYVVISDANLDLLDFINKFQAQESILEYKIFKFVTSKPFNFSIVTLLMKSIT